MINIPADSARLRSRSGLFVNGHHGLAKTTRFVPPMLATLSDVIPIAPGWLYHVKHDGYRMQGHRGREGARLYSRSGLVWTDQLPRIAAGLSELPCASCILDGEAVVQLPGGRDNFHALRSRSGAGRAMLMAFDLLELDGQDLRPWPLVERRAELAHLLASPVDGIAFVDAHDEHGADLLRHGPGGDRLQAQGCTLQVRSVVGMVEGEVS